MSKWMKLFPILAFIAMLVFPMSTFAQSSNQPEVSGKYKLDAKADVKGTTIDVWVDLIGANIVDSGEWQIVPVGPNKAGKPFHAKQSTSAKVHAKFENLKPHVEYCFNIHFTGKLNGETANTVLKLTGKKGMICVTTGDDNNKNPGDDNNGNKPGDDNNGNNPGDDNGNKPGDNNNGSNDGNNGNSDDNKGNNGSSKGGKLPKTATNYPIAMVWSAALLAAGVGMLMFRRTT
jgi:hypothetical protein